MTQPPRPPGAAIILAAGMGLRLGGLAGDRPKGLLEVGGMPLVQRSLEILSACGVERVVLVTGHRAEAYVAFLSACFPAVEVRHNPDYRRSGSMQSLALAEDVAVGEVLVLESDLLYEPRAVTELLERPGDRLLVSGATGQGDEVYAYGRPGRLELLAKACRPDLALQGEFVGISRLTPALVAAMCRGHRAAGGAASGRQYDDWLSDLSRTHPIALHRVDDLVWAEVDDTAQYRRAVTQVLPALAGRRRWPAARGGA